MSSAYFFNMNAHKISLTVGAAAAVEIDGMSGDPYTPSYKKFTRTDLPTAPAGEFGGTNTINYTRAGSDVRNEFTIKVDVDTYSSDDTDILIYCFLTKLVGRAAEDAKPFISDDSQPPLLEIPTTSGHLAL